MQRVLQIRRLCFIVIVACLSFEKKKKKNMEKDHEFITFLIYLKNILFSILETKF